MMNIFRKIRLVGVAAVLGLLLGWTYSSDLPLIEATRSANVQTVSRLISEGVDVNQVTGDGMTALHRPCFYPRTSFDGWC
jgi:hypothetical protein